MKVIELLNKIANKEEVPKYIKYGNYELTYDEDTQDFYNEPACTYALLNNIHQKLNDKIEVIEDTPKEDKKIKKIQLTNGGSTIHLSDFEDYNLTIINREIIKKLNEIIDKINGDNNDH